MEPRPRSEDESVLLDIAARRLPGGVLGGWRLPEDLAFVASRGSGSKIYDASGREYIDYLIGSGPMILGHAHPAVVRAVAEQLEKGTTYFLLNEPILRLADELCRAVPCAEQVRFTSTGSEATFFALRAARALHRLGNRLHRVLRVPARQSRLGRLRPHRVSRLPGRPGGGGDGRGVPPDRPRPRRHHHRGGGGRRLPGAHRGEPSRRAAPLPAPHRRRRDHRQPAKSERPLR